jgi:hypothetical protein
MTNPTFFTVVADFKSVVVDLEADVDPDPQLGPVTGKVTFTPVLANGDLILATNASPRPTMYVPAPIVARIDTDGRLKLRVEPDGDRDNYANLAAFPATGNSAKVYFAIDTQTFYRWNGSQYVATLPYAEVRLLADTPLLELETDLYYRVAFSEVVFNGSPGYIKGFTFQAPTSDTELNLVEVARVPGQPAVGITKIAPGAVRAEDGNLIFSFGGVDLDEPVPYLDVDVTLDAADISDSTATGQALITAANAAAARTAINAASRAAAATGVATADAAALASALSADPLARAEGGTYVVNATGVTVPANKTLVLGSGSKVRTAASLSSSTAITAVTLSTGSSLIGEVDGNRANLTSTAFNTAGGTAAVSHVTIKAYGTEGSPLTGLHVDARVTGAADYIGNFYYVNNSYIRIRASDCGGPVTFNNCNNIRVDIEVDDSDNNGWKTYPHAVDFLNCTGISGRIVIRGQKGTGTVAGGTALSNWFTGLTMVNCTDVHFDEIDAEAADLANQSKGLGVSILGAQDLHCSKTRIVGYSDALLELGGVVDSTFTGLNLDGRYAVSDAGNPSGGGGISLYNNANNSAITGRTLEHTKNVKFFGGSVTRCRQTAINLQAATETSWYGVSVTGSQTGLTTLFANAQVGEGAAPSAGKLSNHRFIGCDFSFNERKGVNLRDGENLTFVNCRANNNSQATPYGETRTGQVSVSDGAGFGMQASTNVTGLEYYGCNADDTQGFTSPGFPDPNTATVIAIDKPEQYGVGQTITITGAGAAGADLKTRINAINHDELTIQTAITTFPTATLTGTIAVTGTAVTGTGTAFNTDLVGRAYIKVGSDYRRILRVASNTEATLEAAFPSNVTAGTALVIVRASISAVNSQQYGFILLAEAISPKIIGGYTPVGNTVLPIADQTVASTPLRWATTSTDPDLLELTAATGQAAVIQTAGPDADHNLTIKSKGAGAVYLRDGSNNIIVESLPTASAVNRVVLSNAATVGSPSLSVAGSDTNIGLTFATKGSGGFTFYAPTGQTPTLRASGPDTDHNLNLLGKGAGTVQINGAVALYSGGALGTPSSATLTNATGLPVSGITASTSTALGVGSVELGHATDTTVARSAAGVLAVEGFDVTTTSVVSVTTTTTLSAVANRHYVILLGSGAVPTLPTAVGNTCIYHVKNTHTASLSLAVTSSQTIDGAAAPLTILPNECFTLVSNATNWVII